MSTLAAVLRKHREELNEEDVCICGHHGDWCAHVAERIEAELQLTEEWGWKLGDKTPHVYGTETEARARVTELNDMFKAQPDSNKFSSLPRTVTHRWVFAWSEVDS